MLVKCNSATDILTNVTNWSRKGGRRRMMLVLTCFTCLRVFQIMSTTMMVMMVKMVMMVMMVVVVNVFQILRKPNLDSFSRRGLIRSDKANFLSF